MQLCEVGFTINQLREAGFSASQLHAVAVQFREAGCAASHLRASGFTVADLQDAGFTSIQLQAAGCTLMELSSLFELVTIHTGAQGADGLVAVSCFNVGGSCVATSHINIGAGLWELLEAIEKEAGRSIMLM